MAAGAEPLTVPRLLAPLATLVAGLVVAGLTLGTLVPLFLAADGGGGRPLFGAADIAALRFTLVQASLSAGLSVLLALPVARALARRQFPGRRALVTLIGAPFILPTVVAVLGLTAVWGRSGLVSELLAGQGWPRLDIYGLTGVVLGNVFFNLPLATRFLLQGWQSVPAEHWRLVAGLGMGPGAVFRHIELPMLREVLPGAVLLIFLLCATSFAVALTLGGGPGASTLELAIYQALRFEFDLPRAAMLGIAQFGLCLVLALALFALGRPAEFDTGLGGRPRRWDLGGGGRLMLDAAVILGIAAFLLLPLGMIVWRGVPALIAGLPAGVYAAALTSVLLALGSALLCLLLAFALGRAIATRRRGVPGEVLGVLSLTASPFVMGTGLFLLINPVADPFALALPVTLTVNAVMSLPFALRALVPALRRLHGAEGRLADHLGLAGWARFRLVTWPAIRRPAGFGAGIAAALSMGDLGVIALFAPADQATLPLAMYRLMGAYRMDAAAGAALLLMVLSLAIFWLLDRGGRSDDPL